MKLQITLRSGAQIEAEVSEFTETYGNVSGSLRGLEWITPAGAARCLKFVDVEQISAIVAVRDPAEAQPTEPPRQPEEV